MVANFRARPVNCTVGRLVLASGLVHARSIDERNEDQANLILVALVVTNRRRHSVDWTLHRLGQVGWLGVGDPTHTGARCPVGCGCVGLIPSVGR